MKLKAKETAPQRQECASPRFLPKRAVGELAHPPSTQPPSHDTHSDFPPRHRAPILLQLSKHAAFLIFDSIPESSSHNNQTIPPRQAYPVPKRLNAVPAASSLSNPPVSLPELAQTPIAAGQERNVIRPFAQPGLRHDSFPHVGLTFNGPSGHEIGDGTARL